MLRTQSHKIPEDASQADHINKYEIGQHALLQDDLRNCGIATRMICPWWWYILYVYYYWPVTYTGCPWWLRVVFCDGIATVDWHVHGVCNMMYIVIE